MTKTPEKIAIISFYCFVTIDEPELLLPKILWVAKRKLIRGTILLSKEGFNGSISGDEQDLNLLLNELVTLTSAIEVSVKVNYADKQPFSKIKVKLKEEIVALKAGKIDVNNLKGEYIESHDWDKFSAQEDVVLIDTRNDYEVKLGTFKGSINPFTDAFSEFPEWVKKNSDLLANKKIAMYCTGGVRCEKSTAFLKQEGYEEVYHLKGGILQYLEDTKNTNNFFEGDCFVFDDRGAVTDSLEPSEGYWVGENQTAKGYLMR